MIGELRQFDSIVIEVSNHGNSEYKLYNEVG